MESEAVARASRSADLTDISAMLLVRLDSIHAALDPSELEVAKVDQQMVRLTEATRGLSGSAAEARSSGDRGGVR